MLNRLVGLETEYAIYFLPDHPQIDRTVHSQLYHALIRTLAERTLTVPASDLKEGVFHGTGGAIWFERVRFAGGSGLIEGATPECRGPREAVLHQRAQDLMLSEAARDAHVPGAFALVKNDCDSQNHVYGAQENYELNLADGWRLTAWRVGLFALLPTLILAWLGHLLLIIGLILYLIIAGGIYVLIWPFLKEEWRTPVQAFLLGEEISGRVAYSSPVPEWVEASALGFIRVVAAPFAIALFLLIRMTTYHTYNRALVPFLMSRAVFCGAGFIDAQGNFQLSDKSWGINCLWGFNGIVFDHPVFSVGHFFKALMFRAWCSPREFRRLMEPRQRLQVCLGDSNLCEEAEYLRVGTTMLVLDAIEAGYLKDIPGIRSPIRTLHKVCADPSLQAEIALKGGERLTAVGLQRRYWEACQKFVEDSPEATEEARDLLHRWDEVLTALETDPSQLVGRVDWVTKQYLLEQTTDETTELASKKKIDIRYHELSPDGYFHRLLSTDLIPTVFRPEEIEQAVRTPPEDTPATKRSRLLREFAGSPELVRANWTSVILGSGLDADVIDLETPLTPEFLARLSGNIFHPVSYPPTTPEDSES